MVGAHVACLWCASEVGPHSQNNIQVLLFLLIALNVAFPCRTEKRLWLLIELLWSRFAEVVQVI